jgi:hypothetical protein
MTCALCEDGDSTQCAERILVFGPDSESVNMNPIEYGSEPMYDDWKPAFHCPDCGVRSGSYHHLSCELEICPNCGDQLVECECTPGVLDEKEALY